jgi:hypothetical protein
MKGILTKNWAKQSTSAILTLVLVIVAPGIMPLTKIVLTVYRVKTRRSSPEKAMII